MSFLASAFLGFVNTLLACALTVLIAWCFVWLIEWFSGKPIKPEVMYWGKIVVGLICIGFVAAYLFSLVAGGPAFNPFRYGYGTRY